MIWVKALHILMVAGWLAGVFIVPRGLIFARREYEELGRTGQAYDLTFRVYRFSALLSAVAVISGLILGGPWFGDTWIWLKIALVAILLAHYIYSGRMLRSISRGELHKSDRYLRIYNELSVLLAFAIIVLVLFKPW